MVQAIRCRKNNRQYSGPQQHVVVSVTGGTCCGNGGQDSPAGVPCVAPGSVGPTCIPLGQSSWTERKIIYLCHMWSESPADKYRIYHKRFALHGHLHRSLRTVLGYEASTISTGFHLRRLTFVLGSGPLLILGSAPAILTPSPALRVARRQRGPERARPDATRVLWTTKDCI
jgi:hypothetical protein